MLIKNRKIPKSKSFFGSGQRDTQIGVALSRDLMFESFEDIVEIKVLVPVKRVRARHLVPIQNFMIWLPVQVKMTKRFHFYETTSFNVGRRQIWGRDLPEKDQLFGSNYMTAKAFFYKYRTFLKDNLSNKLKGYRRQGNCLFKAYHIIRFIQKTILITSLNNKQQVDFYQTQLIKTSVSYFLPAIKAPNTYKGSKHTDFAIVRRPWKKIQTIFSLLALEPELIARIRKSNTPINYIQFYRTWKVQHESNYSELIKKVTEQLHCQGGDVKYLFHVNMKRSFMWLDSKKFIKFITRSKVMRKTIHGFVIAGIFKKFMTASPTLLAESLAEIILINLEKFLITELKIFDQITLLRYRTHFLCMYGEKNIFLKALVTFRMAFQKMGLGMKNIFTSGGLYSSRQDFRLLGIHVFYKQVYKFSKKKIRKLKTEKKKLVERNKALNAANLILKIRYNQYLGIKRLKLIFRIRGFSELDNATYQKLRGWVFRRGVKQGRDKVKRKYFGLKQVYKLYQNMYKSSWVLRDKIGVFIKMNLYKSLKFKTYFKKDLN